MSFSIYQVHHQRGCGAKSDTTSIMETEVTDHNSLMATIQTIILSKSTDQEEEIDTPPPHRIQFPVDFRDVPIDVLLPRFPVAPDDPLELQNAWDPYYQGLEVHPSSFRSTTTAGGGEQERVEEVDGDGPIFLLLASNSASLPAPLNSEVLGEFHRCPLSASAAPLVVRLLLLHRSTDRTPPLFRPPTGMLSKPLPLGLRDDLMRDYITWVHANITSLMLPEEGQGETEGPLLPPPPVDPIVTPKLVVKGISSEVKQQEILLLFSEFGEVDSVDVVSRDSNGDVSSSKYAFVVFREASDAATAMKQLHGFYLRGRYLKISPSVKKECQPRVNASGEEVNAPAVVKDKKVSSVPPSTERLVTPDLVFKNLHEDVDRDQLKELLMPFGNVKQVKILTDRETKKGKGVGFVTFSEVAEAQRAFAHFNGRRMGEKKIRVEPNVSKAQTQAAPPSPEPPRLHTSSNAWKPSRLRTNNNGSTTTTTTGGSAKINHHHHQDPVVPIANVTEKFDDISACEQASSQQQHNDSGSHTEDLDSVEISIKPDDISPCQSFEDIQLPTKLQENIRLCRFTKPTLVQKYGIPVAVQGKDLMACAQTGSGKTAAYLVPAINSSMRHTTANKINKKRTGGAVFPSCLILAPTRELVTQIYHETCKLTHGSPLRSVAIQGGEPNHQWQIQQLRAGCDILVATPGRLLDMVERSVVKFSHLKCLILDEADRMLDMGFEPQIRSLIQGPRSDMPATGQRQTLLYSATFPSEIQQLSREFLDNSYYFLVVGCVGSTTKNIHQDVRWVEDYEKPDALCKILLKIGGEELAVVFVERKVDASNLDCVLKAGGILSTCIHGDRTQHERNEALQAFKTGACKVLVATDVAARGLDIPNVALVVQFDLPANLDDYAHRIGRTGRAGKSGVAISFLNDKNKTIFKPLHQYIAEHNQPVPEWLPLLATGISRCDPRHPAPTSSFKEEIISIDNRRARKLDDAFSCVFNEAENSWTCWIFTPFQINDWGKLRYFLEEQQGGSSSPSEQSSSSSSTFNPQEEVCAAEVFSEEGLSKDELRSAVVYKLKLRWCLDSEGGGRFVKKCETPYVSLTRGDEQRAKAAGVYSFLRTSSAGQEKEEAIKGGVRITSAWTFEQLTEPKAFHKPGRKTTESMEALRLRLEERVSLKAQKEEMNSSPQQRVMRSLFELQYRYHAVTELPFCMTCKDAGVNVYWGKRGHPLVNFSKTLLQIVVKSYFTAYCKLDCLHFCNVVGEFFAPCPSDGDGGFVELWQSKVADKAFERAEDFISLLYGQDHEVDNTLTTTISSSDDSREGVLRCVLLLGVFGKLMDLIESAATDDDTDDDAEAGSDKQEDEASSNPSEDSQKERLPELSEQEESELRNFVEVLRSGSCSSVEKATPFITKYWDAFVKVRLNSLVRHHLVPSTIDVSRPARYPAEGRNLMLVIGKTPESSEEPRAVNVDQDDGKALLLPQEACGGGLPFSPSVLNKVLWNSRTMQEEGADRGSDQQWNSQNKLPAFKLLFGMSGKEATNPRFYSIHQRRLLIVGHLRPPKTVSVGSEEEKEEAPAPGIEEEDKRQSLPIAGAAAEEEQEHRDQPQGTASSDDWILVTSLGIRIPINARNEIPRSLAQRNVDGCSKAIRGQTLLIVDENIQQQRDTDNTTAATPPIDSEWIPVRDFPFEYCVIPPQLNKRENGSSSSSGELEVAAATTRHGEDDHHHHPSNVELSRNILLRFKSSMSDEYKPAPGPMADGTILRLKISFFEEGIEHPEAMATLSHQLNGSSIRIIRRMCVERHVENYLAEKVQKSLISQTSDE